MTVRPAFTPRTQPAASTSATEGSSLLHVRFLLVAFEGEIDAVNCLCSPVAKAADGGATEIASIGTGRTGTLSSAALTSRSPLRDRREFSANCSDYIIFPEAG